MRMFRASKWRDLGKVDVSGEGIEEESRECLGRIDDFAVVRR